MIDTNYIWLHLIGRYELKVMFFLHWLHLKILCWIEYICFNEYLKSCSSSTDVIFKFLNAYRQKKSDFFKQNISTKIITMATLFVWLLTCMRDYITKLVNYHMRDWQFVFLWEFLKPECAITMGQAHLKTLKNKVS